MGGGGRQGRRAGRRVGGQWGGRRRAIWEGWVQGRAGQDRTYVGLGGRGNVQCMHVPAGHACMRAGLPTCRSCRRSCAGPPQTRERCPVCLSLPDAPRGCSIHQVLTPPFPTPLVSLQPPPPPPPAHLCRLSDPVGVRPHHPTPPHPGVAAAPPPPAAAPTRGLRMRSTRHPQATPSSASRPRAWCVGGRAGGWASCGLLKGGSSVGSRGGKPLTQQAREGAVRTGMG